MRVSSPSLHLRCQAGKTTHTYEPPRVPASGGRGQGTRRGHKKYGESRDPLFLCVEPEHSTVEGEKQKRKHLESPCHPPLLMSISPRKIVGRRVRALGTYLEPTVHDMTGSSELICHLEQEKAGRQMEVDKKDAAGRTALFRAAEDGNLSLLQSLIWQGADLDGAPDKLLCNGNSNSFSPLMAAAMRGHEDCALTLVRAGADTALQNQSGRSALHYAAYWGFLDLMRVILIVSAGRAADAEDTSGLNPAAFSKYWWNYNPASCGVLPAKQRMEVLQDLNSVAQRNALWRGRGFPVLLRARFTGGHKIEGGCSLSCMMKWLLERHDHDGLFRHVVSFLGDEFTAVTE
ncbi:unnamed protein product [Chrysoparadoxa australica]